ncbi:kinase-like domain protein [Rutstroemia sp. NJR-2017a WRK4]|nr:kinase-like domain protein [Rutstroemia sp. NJR-2017a WRK4]
MEDSDLIACLYPADDDRQTEEAIRMRENNYGCRESTISVEDEEDTEPTSYSGLQLTFSPGLKTSQGFMIGTDKNRCDIVLPRLPKCRISRLHCVLTFDPERRLVLRNFSQYGTIVTYNGQGGEKRQTIAAKDDKGREKRQYFTWILSGREVPKDVQKIVIQIDKIKFQIIVSKHETYLDLYNDHVDLFLREANADNELSLGALGIQSTTSTAQQSGAHTPTSQTPIYIDQWNLGSGNFSIVNRVWDVSNRSVYTSKEFLHNMKEPEWRREASIMNQGHIIQFVALIERPSPRLILEYLLLGNLEDQHTQQPFSDQESLTILCQSLDALNSVHEDGTVHRDIKPENILVHSRIPLHIKLSVFGLSKVTADLQTFCGTHLYAAPEIYTTPRELSKRDLGLQWCEKIINLVNDWNNDTLLDFLSAAMLVMEPEKLLPTGKCWEQALKLSVPSQSRSPTPTQASSSEPHRGGAWCNTRRAIRDGIPQETNMTLSQATVDHYLYTYNTKEQKLKDRGSIVDSLNKGETVVRKTQTMKRKKDPSDLGLSPRERQLNTPKGSTRHSSSNVQQSKPKPTQQKERNLNSRHFRIFNATDTFKSCWLRNSYCVGSDIAAVDDEGRLNNWTSFHSENPVSASAPDISNKQKNNQCFPLEEIEDSSMLDTEETKSQ